MSALPLARVRRIHYGWVVAIASLVIGTTAYGVYYSFTLFYPKMVEELGWSRGETSGAITVGLVAYGAFALPMGWLLDRFGPKVTIGGGGILFGFGTFLGSRVTDLWQVYALYGCLTAIGMGAAWAPLVSTVSRWFVKRRGFAVGLGGLGGGTGAFFVTPILSRLIEGIGWRQTYVVAGVLSGVIIVGAALLMARDPQSKGMLPYGAEESSAPNLSAAPRLASGASIGQAMHTATFWLMIVMFGFWWFGGSIIYVQLAPFVLEKGFDLVQSATAVTFFGLGNGVGKVGMGLLGDRIGPRLAFGFNGLLAALIMIALVPMQILPVIVILSFLFGVCFGGGAPGLTTITAEFFGLRSLGVLMGTMMALMGAIGAGGPLLGGAMFDRTGSYGPAYLIGAGFLLIATALTFLLRPPTLATDSASAIAHGEPPIAAARSSA